MQIKQYVCPATEMIKVLQSQLKCTDQENKNAMDFNNSQVSMLDGRNRALFTTSPGAKPGSKWDDDLIGPYCFYSPSGNVKVGQVFLKPPFFLCHLTS